MVLFALLSVAAARPKPGYLGGWDSGLDIGHGALTLEHAPVLQAAPVIHAAPVVHAAPVAVAKAATSYSSFQRVIHPVAHHVVAQPVVHAAPVIHAAPVVHTVAQPIISHGSIGGYGYGHGW
ncbi:unnamed protein product, partial [Brenthis ino]